MSEPIPVSCNRDCGGACPLIAHVEQGRVTRITDNPLGKPVLSGCVRGWEMARALYAPDRLTQPLLRTGPRGSGQFRAIPWPEALDRVAEGLTNIQQRYGHEAILHLGGSGSCRGALHNTSTLTARFLSLFGGYTKTYGGYSSAAANFATPYVLGQDHAGIDPGTLQWSNLILLWGANVADCRLGTGLDYWLTQAHERGTEIVVLDPRQTATARRWATQWIPVRPGTDSALMLAVLHVLITEGLVDADYIARYSVGYEALRAYVLGLDGSEPKTPAWAAARCGTPAETITALARRYGAAKPAALIPGLSLQRTLGGEEAVRLAIALQTVTGNLGVRGGSSGALAWWRLPGPRVGRMSIPTPPRQALIPVYRWPDAILEGRGGGYPSDIAAIYNVGGNYLVEGADVRKGIRAFERVEFSVCHELFLTPTARHCDIVLPVTTALERQDVISISGNYLLFSNRAVTPLAEARNDYDIFCALAERLGFLQAFSEDKDEEAWLRGFIADSEVPDYEAFKRSGIHWGADQLRVGLADFVADPQRHPLSTPSGRVELASEAYACTGYPAIPTARLLPNDPQYPLQLVTPKSRYRVHSQNANLPWFRAREPQTLWIHPQDAQARGIQDGQAVRVTSAEGCVQIPARVTDEIMPGVVCLLEGIWPEFDAAGIDTAGCANVLTSTVPTEPSHGSRTHSVQVEVTPANAV